MRIFITLLIIANLLFWGVNYFVIEPKKATAISKEVRKKGDHSLVLLSELERGELIVDLVGRETEAQVDNGDNKQLVECLKIVGDWDQNGLLSVKEKIESLGKNVVSQGKERRKKVNYWVLIPSFASKLDAITAKKALQSAKVVDTFIIKSGARANALSLGLYSKEEGARRRASYINGKKLGIAKAGIEELTLYVDRHWLKIAPMDEDFERITIAVGNGVIDTKLDQCEIDR